MCLAVLSPDFSKGLSTIARRTGQFARLRKIKRFNAEGGGFAGDAEFRITPPRPPRVLCVLSVKILSGNTLRILQANLRIGGGSIRR
jgi:hypothetical protein